MVHLLYITVKMSHVVLLLIAARGVFVIGALIVLMAGAKEIKRTRTHKDQGLYSCQKRKIGREAKENQYE